MDFVRLFFFFSCMIIKKKREFFGTLKDLRREQKSTQLFGLPKSKQSLNSSFLIGFYIPSCLVKNKYSSLKSSVKVILMYLASNTSM